MTRILIQHRPSLGPTYAAAAQEDRCAPRAELLIPATLRIAGGRGFQTTVHDLSLAGFSADAVSRLRAGTRCWLTLPGLQAQQSLVVWWADSRVGCAFDTLLSPLVLDNLLAHYRTAS